MTSKQYFDALCKSEAGEFIYQAVDNVEGVYQVRPRIAERGNAEQQDRYVIEDPFGHGPVVNDTPRSIGYSLTGPNRYKFVEIPVPPLQKGDRLYRELFDESMLATSNNPRAIYRLSGFDEKSFKTLRATISDSVSSKYGFTWRGISRPMDRELAIAGGELIVVRLSDNAILAVRRGFSRTGFARTRDNILWGNAESCPGIAPGIDAARPFLMKVLRPRIEKAKS